MNKSSILISILVVLVIGGGSFFFLNKKAISPTQVACTLEAKICPDGSSVGRSGPKCEFAPCPTMQDAHANLIRVFYPLPNASIQSPLTVRGEARGNWYFEASFPIRVLDANGKVLVAVPAQAKGDWMTTEFVPFEVTLSFPKPTTTTGTIVLQKDNASGLPEHEDSISIPVRFSQ